MEDSTERQILIVANRTAATPLLLAEVRRRAASESCRFALLVPRSYWHADTEESAIAPELPGLLYPVSRQVDGGACLVGVGPV